MSQSVRFVTGNSAFAVVSLLHYYLSRLNHCGAVLPSTPIFPFLFGPSFEIVKNTNYSHSESLKFLDFELNVLN